MPAFLHDWDALEVGAWGLKGDGLIRAAKAGLPLAPGFLLRPGEQADLPAALKTLEQRTGLTCAALEQGFFLYIRLLPFTLKPGRLETAQYLGLHPAQLSDDAPEIFTRKAAIGVWSQLSALSGRDLETLEDWLEDQGLAPLEFKPTTAHILRYTADLEAQAGLDLARDPLEQIITLVVALQEAEPDLPILLSSMVPYDLGARSLRARLVTRDATTGIGGVVGQRLRSRLPGETGTRVTGEMVLPRLETLHRGLREALNAAAQTIENTFQQIMEFDISVDRDGWHILHLDPAQPSPDAALQIAVDLQAHGHIDQREALSRLFPAELESLLHPTLDPEADRPVLCSGFAAAPGAVSGKLVFDTAEALARARKGEAVILAKTETQPDDVRAMMAAAGVLTVRGGMTSHAAVIARGLGKPAIVGARDLIVDAAKEIMLAGDLTLAKDQAVTLDGATGEILFGAVPTRAPTVTPAFKTLMGWADAQARLEVRANTESTKELSDALALGAKGIGLCRTEHMLLSPGRLAALRKLILVEEETAREQALDDLRILQRQDLLKLFTITEGRPMTVRLLDPPLHEFLPHNAKEVKHLADTTGLPRDLVIRRGRTLSEANPMLGHRGCRLGITFPDIYDMQIRAILEAAAEVSRTTGHPAQPEIMIPLVAFATEAQALRQRVERIERDVRQDSGVDLGLKVGAMIELPRACLRADRIAEFVDFFSFGTNDLTQTTFGISRDDAGKFLSDYDQQNVMEEDPFLTLDQLGVGELIDLACQRGRAVNSNLTLGVCGEHGGDPASIAFFERLGFDYISCSPYRVPIARLAAAQAAGG